MEIRKDGTLYAIVHRADDWKEGLDFVTPPEEAMQVGTFLYESGKQCKPHKHLLNQRSNDYTQECFIVLSGVVAAKIYDDKDEVHYTVILHPGDMIILFRGGHGFDILEDDTRIIECKNGPFISVEKDKVPI